MNDELKEQLANALEVDPDQIMDYRQVDGDSYNVILFSYQKYTNVEPKEVSPIPPELRSAYQSPSKANKAQLIKVADLLELETSPKMTKKDLVMLIESYKVTTVPVPEVAAAPAADHMQAHDVTDWE